MSPETDGGGVWGGFICENIFAIVLNIKVHKTHTSTICHTDSIIPDVKTLSMNKISFYINQSTNMQN